LIFGVFFVEKYWDGGAEVFWRFTGVFEGCFGKSGV
jgi:hypothetical protein